MRRIIPLSNSSKGMTSRNIQNAHYRVQHIWGFQCKFYCFFPSLCFRSWTEQITFKRESQRDFSQREKAARDFFPPLNFALKKKKRKQRTWCSSPRHCISERKELELTALSFEPVKSLRGVWRVPQEEAGCHQHLISVCLIGWWQPACTINTDLG